jgi:hypothetical protein
VTRLVGVVVLLVGSTPDPDAAVAYRLDDEDTDTPPFGIVSSRTGTGENAT